MTTVQITLPDDLAQNAQQAGLLAPEAVEAMLRAQLKARALDGLFEAMDRMADVEPDAAMSAEDVAEEIHRMRAERRANKAN